MSPLQKAMVAGGSLFLTGFGAMATLSSVYQPPDDVLGFTDYLSATWGDAVLLPTTMAALVYVYNTLPPVRGDRLLLVSGGIIGMAAGATTQVLWLLDDAPQLNWTLPAPHTFNGAGMYHAVFLTGAAAAFGAAWAGTLLRWVRNPQIRDRRVGRAMATALLSGLGFACLLVLDNQHAQGRSSSTAPLIVLGGAVLTAVAGTATAIGLRRRHPQGENGHRLA